MSNLILPFYFRELLALLSQYADARKSRYMDILMALNRLETLLIKQTEQNSVNCLVPAEKLFSLFSELQTSSNESNEVLVVYKKANNKISILANRIWGFSILFLTYNLKNNYFRLHIYQQNYSTTIF